MISTQVSGASAVAPSSVAGKPVAKTASDFEAMAIDQFLQPMFASGDEGSGLFDGGQAEATLKPMLITEFAKLMEQRGGLGLAGPIEAKLEQLQQTKDATR